MTLLDILQSKGIIVSTDGDRLRVDAPAGALTDDLRAIIVENKATLIAQVTHPSIVFLVADGDDPAEWNKALAAKIAALFADRDRLGQRLNNGADYLATLQQDAPEFERWFAEWERVNEEYKAACDRIGCLEMTQRIREQPEPSAEETASA